MLGGVEIAVVLLVVALLVVVPKLRSAATERMDGQALGRRELEQIRQTHPVEACRSPAVNRILKALQRQQRPRQAELRALVVQREGLNAAALADGTVLLWAGLVEAVDQGAVPVDELAGVLAHEVAHIQLGHGRQRAAQELMLRPLVGRLGAAFAGPIGGVALGKGVDLLRKGASRQAELEADREALRLLRAAGFEPDGLARFLRRLARLAPEQPEWAAWLSTHPHMSARLEALAGR